MVVKRVAPKASSRNQPLSKITHEKKQSGFHKTSSSKNDAKSEKKGKLNVIRQTKTISSNKVGPESTSTDNLSRSLIIAEKAFENVSPTALDIRDDTNDTSLAGMTNNQRKLAQATKIIGASNDPFVVASAVVSGVAAAVASDASSALESSQRTLAPYQEKSREVVAKEWSDCAEGAGIAKQEFQEWFVGNLNTDIENFSAWLRNLQVMKQEEKAAVEEASTLKVVKKKGMRKRKAKKKNENKNENKKKTEAR